MSIATLHPASHHHVSMRVRTPRTEVPARLVSCGHRHQPTALISVVPQRTGLRLTRRGRTLLAIVLLAVVSATAIVGALRATAAPSAPPVGWVEVIVQPGDSLWGLAVEAGQDEGDPRAVMADIRSVNSLRTSSLAAGDRIWVPKPQA